MTEPVVTPTPEQLAAEDERQRIVSLQFRQRHVLDFKPTPENIAAMGAYISKNNLPWDEDSLEQAFEALQDTLEPITSADIDTQSKTISRQITEKKPDVPWPQPLTKRAINRIPPEKFKEWMKDKRFLDEINQTFTRR